ncbi:YcdB/YcdC domain-containing protein [Paenibacillus anseongense]|uniref:YcdB/YcdC domain-containing protein n=1 Tax=Paenibacillus anseongense TaxID=2682845 RepID=UPI002DBC347B|nr:YcdB/YcdC domain-containing protein [Paenibacillus anseongense]MEC0264727.1 hypothetical protein [Paenibacillus anseongense]
MKKRRNTCFVLASLFTLLLASNVVLAANAETSEVRLDQVQIQVQEYATQYIEKEYPFAKDQLMFVDYQENTFVKPNFYNIRYIRAIDGIRYPGNYINLDIDKTGKVVDKQILWDKNVQLPESEPVISVEEARAKFTEQLVPTFSQVFPEQLNKGEKKIGIYETVLSDNWQVDAVTGKVHGGMNQPALEQNTKMSSTNKEIVQPVDSAEKALKRAIELAVIPTNALNPLIYQVVEGLNSNLSGPFWKVIWRKPIGTEYCSSSVEIQLSTGELTSFSNSCPLEGKHLIVEDEAKQISGDYLKKVLPQVASALTLYSIKESSLTLPTRMGDKAYLLIYTANLSGIYYGHVSIMIDIQSGEVISVNNSLKGTLPADIPQFDEPKLKSMLLKAYDVIPTYYTPPLNLINKKEDEIIQTNLVTITEDPVKPVLVYSLVRKASYNNYFLDAKDAVWRDFSTGKLFTVNQIESRK